MARIVVIGAGLNGMAAALLLASDGYEVTVVERDSAPVPVGDAEAIWRDWQRPGIAQFRLPHALQPRWLATMLRELPNVVEELHTLGGTHANLLDVLPDTLRGDRMPGDERFDTVTVRRPLIDAAFARVMDRSPRVTVRRGAAVTGLTLRENVMTGVPRVTGVVCGDTTLTADLVVDASGRRWPVKKLLSHAGVKISQTKDDAGFVYYARHFRSANGAHPTAQGFQHQQFESVSLLTLPGDRGSWAVSFVVSAADRDLRALRDPVVWEESLALFPTVAPWMNGEPMSGIQPMSGGTDRISRLVHEGTPTVTGLVALGDAWATTNPALGRGATIGLLHACALRDVLRTSNTDAAEQVVLKFDETTEQKLTGMFKQTRAHDRHRIAEVTGEISGIPYANGTPGWSFALALENAAMRDPVSLRIYLAQASLLKADDASIPSDIIERVARFSRSACRYSLPGPTREELLSAVRRSSKNTCSGEFTDVP